MESEEEASRRGKKGMVFALAASYFTVMGAKCALPTVLPLLLDPTVGLVFSDKWHLSPQELVSRQLTLATLAVAVGKLLLGPVIDRFGGILSLQVALSMLGVLLAAISLGSSFLGFAIGWIFVDFIFSSCWAACINAIHQSFPPDQWARQIGTLAAAARAGNAVAFASFAAVLQFFSGRMKQTWRPVFAISAVIQIFPVLLLRYFGGRVNKQEAFLNIKSKSKKPSLGQSLKTLRTEAGTPEFWLHLVSRSSLMVFASFLLFVPTLMCQVYQSSPAFGAQTGSIYALGCLVAVTGVSPVYSRLPCRGKVAMLIGLLSVATATSGAQWAHMAGLVHMSAPMSATILFLWGFAFALPFYSTFLSVYYSSRGSFNISLSFIFLQSLLPCTHSLAAELSRPLLYLMFLILAVLVSWQSSTDTLRVLTMFDPRPGSPHFS
jgi:MFS family permease